MRLRFIQGVIDSNNVVIEDLKECSEKFGISVVIENTNTKIPDRFDRVNFPLILQAIKNTKRYKEIINLVIDDIVDTLYRNGQFDFVRYELNNNYDRFSDKLWDNDNISKEVLKQKFKLNDGVYMRILRDEDDDIIVRHYNKQGDVLIDGYKDKGVFKTALEAYDLIQREQMSNRIKAGTLWDYD